jgi:hypothetical protein
VPYAGVITSWSHFAGSGSQTLKLKVARAIGPNSFTIVGGSFDETTVAGVLNTFPARVSVGPGDVIGLFTTGSTPVAASDSSYAYHFVLGDPPTGSTAAFLGPFGGRKLDVSVTLERDCDGDSFGDETQDPVVSKECRDDAVPPETKILKANTGRRSKFKFATTEPAGARFRCRLDDKRYKPCETPKRIRVGHGSHTFRVFSIDAAGNADPTPARAEWTVRKRTSGPPEK